MEAATDRNAAVNSLAEAVRKFQEQSGMSGAAIADKIGYSRPALSRYLNGTYGDGVKEIEGKLTSFLEEMTGIPVAVLIGGKQKILQSRGYFRTIDASKVLLLCDNTQRDHGLGMIVGKSGTGKSYNLKLLSKREKAAYVECSESFGCRDLVREIENALELPHVRGTIWERLKEIIEFFNNNEGWLLLIDEADKLISRSTAKKIEILRTIFDQSRVGLVIAGEIRLKELLKNNVKRFANRIDFYEELKGLTEKEVAEYLTSYDVDAAALEMLKKRACGDRDGCFRLLDRTLRNCFRQLNQSGETRITAEVVRRASSGMML